jgi:hypothetical protein
VSAPAISVESIPETTDGSMMLLGNWQRAGAGFRAA